MQGTLTSLTTASCKHIACNLVQTCSQGRPGRHARAIGVRAGNKRSVRMESNDITAGLDDLRYNNYGDADDDVDFM